MEVLGPDRMLPKSFTCWPQVQRNPSGIFPCDMCGKEYKYKHGLNRHKKYECGQKPKYQCPHCPYRAKQKINLKTHMAIKHSVPDCQGL
ncbi:hypothetical protein M8J75_016140 [Diaphorina citri]|nr:hypothetical protein M8J75_016140 [Diaphorina citri]